MHVSVILDGSMEPLHCPSGCPRCKHGCPFNSYPGPKDLVGKQRGQHHPLLAKLFAACPLPTSAWSVQSYLPNLMPTVLCASGSNGQCLPWPASLSLGTVPGTICSGGFLWKGLVLTCMPSIRLDSQAAPLGDQRCSLIPSACTGCRALGLYADVSKVPLHNSAL